MNDQQNGPLSDLLFKRTNVAELILVAVFVAFGVSIVAGSITVVKGFQPRNGIIIGTIIFTIAFIYILLRTYSQRNRKRTYKGFLIYHKPSNKLVEVERYSFGEDICDYLDSAFQENSALNKMWEQDRLESFYTYDKKKKTLVKKDLKSVQLIIEATEYFVLSKLSTHLTDYFNKSEFKQDDLYTFERHELPDVLLSNKFLELFSKAMEERPCFANDLPQSSEEHGKVVMAFGKNGARYEEFNLVLPKGSLVRRKDKNKIEIETNRFKINLYVKFDGAGTIIPRGFEKYYLATSVRDTHAYKVILSVSIHFKLRSLLSMKGWEYYKWVDSFLNKLDMDISQDTFFEQVNWNSIYTAILCFENINRAMKNVASAKDDAK